VRTTRGRLSIAGLAIFVAALSASACGTPISAPSASRATLLPPSTDPAPWADASTIPTVTTTTIAVTSPFIADQVAHAGTAITLDPTMKTADAVESAALRFELVRIVDPALPDLAHCSVEAGAPRKPGYRWVMLKLKVSNLKSPPGVAWFRPSGLFVEFAVEPEVTNQDGVILYSSVNQNAGCRQEAANKDYVETLPLPFRPSAGPTCDHEFPPNVGTSVILCEPLQIPVGLRIGSVSVGFGFMTGLAAPGEWMTGEWLVP
jgi:hypothetical protein